MAQFQTGTISNRWLGVLMLGAGALTIAAMLHHPDAVNGDEATNRAMRWIHGILIFLIIMNAYAVWRFTYQVQSKAHELVLGLIFYWVAVAAFIGGALISGFVQSDVSDLYANQALNNEMFGAFNGFAAILNQTLIKFGLLSFGMSGLIWTIPLLSSAANTKLVGGMGFVVGACLVTTALLGLSLSVFAMTALTCLIVLWHGSIAVWFFKNNDPEVLSHD